ncbi:MAG: host attachment protein [Gammaproteobacteria bacterium]|nr:host attachment protein [Gammaproteobacteria bacterium]MDH5801417.1 host attachment protein [Gammaproteobacteria bacterium]
MNKTWVVVAESSRSRIFNMEKINGPLVEILTFDNPEARKHDAEILADRTGRSYDSHGHGRNDISEHYAGKQEAERFARQLAELLDSHRLTGDYEQLILFAAPTFLGLLREHLTESTNRLIVHDSNKNLVQFNADKIRDHIPKPIPRIIA